MTLTNTNPNDTPALNAALRLIADIHQGSRAVNRTDNPTDREHHRRIIDTHIRAMHARAETIALETDDPDVVTIAHHIGRAIDRIGYR